MALTSAAELQSVSTVTERLQILLQQARSIQPSDAIEAPLLPSSELASGIDGLHDKLPSDYDQAYRFAIVETAARELFSTLISSTSIEDTGFVDVWHLLDILLLCGDRGNCAPELVCWLIEELLDSQTTHGCRTVFDYLESRRERLARKDFHKKNLIFLRTCNELLRRLSRAEDAIFCGRVFFFLFQTFPLGDKSSVNLRGEFHVENNTKFEVSGPSKDENGEKMEIDIEALKAESETPKPTTPAKEATPQPSGKPGSKAVPIKAPKKVVEEEVLENDVLYPIFWRLQQDFSDPTRLFVSENFEGFKKGLGQTITKFKKTPTVVQTKSAESNKRGQKRKLGDDGSDGDSVDTFADNYNPKYLTSRELFKLELTDLAFQRHIQVQALILIDFLLSLTERSKKKLESLQTANKSMLYAFTLSEDDTKWALATRATIKSNFQVTTDGRFYDRMVETVLSRDKNWVRWKIESCPSMVRDAVTTEQELEARSNARSYTRPRRLPEKPMGAMDLSFLDGGHGGGLESLKDQSKWLAPTIENLLDGIQTDKLDLEMADGPEKESLENMVQNKTWRALRQARSNRLGMLNKIEPGKDIEAVFRPPLNEEGHEMNGPAVVVDDADANEADAEIAGEAPAVTEETAPSEVIAAA